MTPPQPSRIGPSGAPRADRGWWIPGPGAFSARPAVSTRLRDDQPGVVEIRCRETLTFWTAFAFCRAVREHLNRGAQSLVIDLADVASMDAAGLAALLQSARLARLLGTAVAIAPSSAAYRALLDAGLLDELSVTPTDHDAPPSEVVSNVDWLEVPGPFLAMTPRLGLRPPTWDELVLFEKWAHEPLLDQMVGSELLYRCRHLGPYHPEVVASLLSEVRSLTLLVVPLGAPAEPVGFVRLYDIHLLEQFAFLETAVADPHALRRGWGIEASRLLIAYAGDLLGLRRIEAKVFAYNTLSINSLKRNGFLLEGVLREAKTYDARRWDIFVFSILRPEMDEQRARERFPYMGFWG